MGIDGERLDRTLAIEQPKPAYVLDVIGRRTLKTRAPSGDIGVAGPDRHDAAATDVANSL